jgi:hypothetical protein
LKSKLPVSGLSAGTVPPDVVNIPRVVIVGGGFGVTSARALAGSRAQVLLVHRLTHETVARLITHEASSDKDFFRSPDAALVLVRKQKRILHSTGGHSSNVY